MSASWGATPRNLPLLLLALALLWACTSQPQESTRLFVAPPTPAAMPVATVEHFAQQAPAAAQQAPAAVAAMQTMPISVTLGALQFTLPADWAAAADETSLAQLWVPRGGVPLLVAWSRGDNFAQARLRFSVVQAPRNGLALERYVAGVAAGLAAEAGVTVESATIVTDLRQDGLPAGTIRYRVAGSGGVAQGHQIVLVDPDGQQLFILTIAIAPALAGGASSTLDNLLRMLALVF